MNKGLRISTLIGLAALLPCVALADAPSNMAAGEVEAILKFCAETDGRLEKDVEAHLTLVTGKLAPGARGSAEYKEGYDLVSDSLAKVAKPTALAACATLAAPRHSPEPRAGDRR
jgi:hypothetical protein